MVKQSSLQLSYQLFLFDMSVKMHQWEHWARKGAARQTSEPAFEEDLGDQSCTGYQNGNEAFIYGCGRNISLLFLSY